MKLFIKNQSDFIDSFPVGGNSTNYQHSKIHQLAFIELSNSFAGFNIPYYLMPLCNDEGDKVVFEFKAYRNGVFFYEFEGKVE